MVVTVFRSEEEFQALAMRLAARLLLPGTGWIAFMQLMDQVGLMMDHLGKRYLPRGSLALLDFHTCGQSVLVCIRSFSQLYGKAFLAAAVGVPGLQYTVHINSAQLVVT